MPDPRPPWFRRPVSLALAFGVLAEALFLFRVEVPRKLVFDEIHYVPAARALLALTRGRNTEHPLLGKELIGFGIWLFGDNSFGWRIMSTLAGSAVVTGVFAIAWLIWGRVRTAALAAAVALLNFTVFVQARIAMLDGFMAAFTVGGIAALLWSMRAGSVGAAWWRWLAGAALLGLGTACKWAALPYVGFAGAAFLWVRVRDAWAPQEAGSSQFPGVGRGPATMRTDSVALRVPTLVIAPGPRPSPGNRLGRATSGRGQRHWPGMTALRALLSLGVVAALAYLVTFTPAFFYADQPLTLRELLPFQAEMYRQQTQILPSHPYQSAWWTWPLMIRPIWYLYEPVDGAQRGVLMLGSPAVLWSGPVAVALCLWTGWRERDPKPTAAALLWIAGIAVWVVIPKSLGFFYYYYLPSILLALPIAGAWHRFGRGRLSGWDEAHLLLLAALFAWFYPILSALPLAGPQSFQRWMWFASWR